MHGFLSTRGRNYNGKSIWASTQVCLTGITEAKSPSQRAEAAITPFRGALLIFCSIWTCLLALQVLNLAFKQKNTHIRRRSRHALTSVCCLFKFWFLSFSLTNNCMLIHDTWLHKQHVSKFLWRKSSNLLQCWFSINRGTTTFQSSIPGLMCQHYCCLDASCVAGF